MRDRLVGALLLEQNDEWAVQRARCEIDDPRRRVHPVLIDVGEGAGGLDLERCIYVNFPGAFGWFLHARLLGRKVIAPESARVVDRLVPFISAVERLLPPITGQSIFAVMRNPGV